MIDQAQINPDFLIQLSNEPDPEQLYDNFEAVVTTPGLTIDQKGQVADRILAIIVDPQFGNGLIHSLYELVLDACINDADWVFGVSQVSKSNPDVLQVMVQLLGTVFALSTETFEELVQLNQQSVQAHQQDESIIIDDRVLKNMIIAISLGRAYFEEPLREIVLEYATQNRHIALDLAKYLRNYLMTSSDLALFEIHAGMTMLASELATPHAIDGVQFFHNRVFIDGVTTVDDEEPTNYKLYRPVLDNALDSLAANCELPRQLEDLGLTNLWNLLVDLLDVANRWPAYHVRVTILLLIKTLSGTTTIDKGNLTLAVTPIFINLLEDFSLLDADEGAEPTAAILGVLETEGRVISTTLKATIDRIALVAEFWELDTVPPRLDLTTRLAHVILLLQERAGIAPEDRLTYKDLRAEMDEEYDDSDGEES